MKRQISDSRETLNSRLQESLKKQSESQSLKERFQQGLLKKLNTDLQDQFKKMTEANDELQKKTLAAQSEIERVKQESDQLKGEFFSKSQ